MEIDNIRIGIVQNDLGGFWRVFKVRNPQVAKAIECLSDRDMDTLSDADASHIVTTFLEWSINSNTPVSKLKEIFVGFADDLISSGATFRMLIDQLKKEKAAEARRFNIPEEYTISNYMFEWLLEMQDRKKSDYMLEFLVRALNLTHSEKIKAEIHKIDDRLHLAPDISQYDREENRLFTLANEGAMMLNKFLPYGISDIPNYYLTEGGKIEARILCSTMVIELHSNFKNELNMHDKTDRYFVLLANSIRCDVPGGVIDFINSRIAFYQQECQNSGEMDDVALIHIFNAMYSEPLSEHPEDINIHITDSTKVIFKNLLYRVRNTMLHWRKIISHS